jgi:hypothetical protein
VNLAFSKKALQNLLLKRIRTYFKTKPVLIARLAQLLPNESVGKAILVTQIVGHHFSQVPVCLKGANNLLPKVRRFGLTNARVPLKTIGESGGRNVGRAYVSGAKARIPVK